jgi:hypothetical protein
VRSIAIIATAIYQDDSAASSPVVLSQGSVAVWLVPSIYRVGGISWSASFMLRFKLPASRNFVHVLVTLNYSVNQKDHLTTEKSRAIDNSNQPLSFLLGINFDIDNRSWRYDTSTPDRMQLHSTSSLRRKTFAYSRLLHSERFIPESSRCIATELTCSPYRFRPTA